MEIFIIRRAELKDACDIARVRITGWQQSYKGLMPDAVLAKLNVEADRRRVEEALADKDSKTLRFVVELDNKIVGMGACGKARDIAGKRAEVYAIYLLDEVKGQGLGGNFMREMAEALQANGYESLQVSVLERNTVARKFYEKLGGKLSRTGVFKFEGVEMPDVTYEWEDIKNLVKGNLTQ